MTKSGNELTEDCRLFLASANDDLSEVDRMASQVAHHDTSLGPSLISLKNGPGPDVSPLLSKQCLYRSERLDLKTRMPFAHQAYCSSCRPSLEPYGTCGKATGTVWAKLVEEYHG